MAALSLAPIASRAEVPELPLEHVHHATWTSKQGAPPDVWTMAQTTDGWIWFGGPAGLHRFDGVAFERVESLPAGSDRSRAVSSLLALKSGALVVGYRNGGVAIRRGASTTNYREADGFDGGTVFALAADLDGHVWAGTRTGLLRFDGTHWRRFGPSDGLPAGAVTALMVDLDGRLWVGAADSTLVVERGQDTLHVLPGLKAMLTFALDAKGRTWCGTSVALMPCPIQPAAGSGPRAMADADTSNNEVFTAEGTFWYLSDGGLVRRQPDPGLTSLPLVDPEPGTRDAALMAFGNDGKTLLHDRAGNIWMTTLSGEVHEFRTVPVEELRRMPRLNETGALAVSHDGGVWMPAQGNYSVPMPGDGLWRLDGAQSRIQPSEIKSASVAFEPRDGALRFAGEGWLWRRTADRFEHEMPLPVRSGINPALAMADDAATGSLWVSMYGAGLWLRRGDTWQRNGGISALPPENATAMTGNGDTLWLGYADGRVRSVRGADGARTVEVQDSHVGAVRVIGAGRFVLAGGDRGLALLLQGRFQLLTTAEAGTLEGLTGLVQTANGDVWLNGLAGAVHIPHADLQHVVDTGNPAVNARVFDRSDGYPDSGATKMPFGNSMASAPDGRIWFCGATRQGWLDPATIPRTASTSPLLLRALRTAAGRIPIQGALKLEAGTRDLQVDYTALNYAHPDRERFRYRLMGLSDAWTNAGARREAFFTNVGPGHYVFEVQSHNETGGWANASAKVAIDIPPTFLQSWAFAALCVLGGLLVLGLAVRARDEHLRRREQAKLHERLAERERIARELHDTLLQSTQGLALKVQAAASRLPYGEPARTILDNALQDADTLMVEGRDRIQELRGSASDPVSLEAALRSHGRKLSAEHRIDFELSVTGGTKLLNPMVADEAYRIGAEAMLNAFRHAKATRVEVELIYQAEVFRVRVRDDGIGLDHQVLKSGYAPGRWGMRGMRERAARVGAMLEVWSAPDAGTEIDFRVPSSAVYEAAGARPWPRLWRRWKARLSRRRLGAES